jgi:hypothetical protein
MPAITGATVEIQPRQWLIQPPETLFAAKARAESVDAANPRLYKGGDGGGRNPAAAVL